MSFTSDTETDEDGSFRSASSSGDGVHALYVWEFILAERIKGLGGRVDEVVDRERLTKGLKEYCVNWGFQLEEGKDGYRHYQGRVRLPRGKKLRMAQMKDVIGYNWVHLQPTSRGGCKTEFFYTYTMKLDTRIEGPWSDQDSPNDLPSDWLEDAPNGARPDQEKIIQRCLGKPDRRHINLLLDVAGGWGKTTLYKLLVTRAKHVYLLDTHLGAREMLLAVCNYLKGQPKQWLRDEPYIFIADVPRAEGDRKEVWACLERIKSGTLTETRYSTTVVKYMVPHIWVFTNKMPNKKHLTPNRWNIIDAVHYVDFPARHQWEEVREVVPPLEHQDLQAEFNREAAPEPEPVDYFRQEREELMALEEEERILTENGY